VRLKAGDDQHTAGSDKADQLVCDATEQGAGEIREDDVGRGTWIGRIRDLETDARTGSVEAPVLACALYRIRIEIDPARGRRPKGVRGEREHTRPRPHVEHASVRQRDLLQHPEAQARGLVMASAESH